MTNDPPSPASADPSAGRNQVELPRPTAAPMILSLGMVLLAAGFILGTAFLVVGAVVVVAGLAVWVGQMLPGRGHVHEPLVEPERRPRPVQGQAGKVERLETGMPGYRLRLPVRVHPISAGVKGGILGGLVMPIPALIWGWLSGYGVWYPVNLLAGMMLPGIGSMPDDELRQFHATLFTVAVLIHVVTSLVVGLVYGVLLPTLPEIPRPLAWGGLLMPVLWTAASFGLMEILNPVLRRNVDWPAYIGSQFIFGVVSALVFMRAERLGEIPAALLGGAAGGLVMPLPAVLWSLSTGHGLWYPANLLAAMVPGLGGRSVEELEQFHAGWLTWAVVLHAALSLDFGLAYGLVLPKLWPIPAPLAWGGLVMPILWTGASFGLMGVVNPVLQQRVNWPWFIVSQFVFGVAAAIVVVRSETVPVPPAGAAAGPT
jgi:hypothetical protein